MNKRTEREINKIFVEVFKKVYKELNKGEFTKGDINRVIYKFNRSRKYNEFCKEFAKKLARQGLNHEKGLWRKYFEAAKLSHVVGLPKTFKDFEIKMFKQVIKENFKMIKSIPDEVMKVYEFDYINTLIKERLLGLVPRGTFERKLREAGNKKAKLVARTESAKLETYIVESNSTELGSIMYRWSSTKDVRTRKSHRDMNDVIVFWKDTQEEKPLLDDMYGNAGEFPNCRCNCIPIFDLDREYNKSNYRVYDYKSHKVVTMTKKQLQEKIKKETSIEED